VLETELRRRIESALQAVPGVTSADDADLEAGGQTSSLTRHKTVAALGKCLPATFVMCQVRLDDFVPGDA
jgi:hypothetical protein